MNNLGLFLDISPVAGGVGVFLVVAMIFIGIAAAFFAYIMLRKTVKMAVRMIIVAAILLIAVVGSVSFLWFSSGSSSKQTKPNRPSAAKPN